jgi:hypothetical protein
MFGSLACGVLCSGPRWSNDPIDVRIKGPPRARGAARTRSAMEHERGLAGGPCESSVKGVRIRNKRVEH